MATSSILKKVVLNDNKSTKMFMDAIEKSKHIIVEEDESSFECKEVNKRIILRIKFAILNCIIPQYLLKWITRELKNINMVRQDPLWGPFFIYEK